MNFKYFLRGLGVGIVFSAIICLAVYNGRGTVKMSDDEIIQRAKQMGYVKEDDVVERQIEKLKNENKEQTSEKQNKKNENDESTVSTDKKQEVDSKTEKDVTTEKASEETTTTEQVTTEKVTTEKETTEEATTESKKDATTEAKSEGKKKEDKKNTDEITFSIEAGSSSYPVCLKLKDLGLVDNAEEFDTYLVENGYANRISVGSHSLKKGMSYHDIAEAISDPLE